MPKKRHQAKYSKPQSTAPASLSSRSSAPHGGKDDHPGRSVNELLADLRRANLNGQPSASVAPLTAPSVPPAIRHILQLPETPAPPPRRPTRLDPRGRRLPPGPPPPRSWLSLSRHAPRPGNDSALPDFGFERRDLPDAYRPESGSLIDISLRSIAIDWEYQRVYNQYYLYSLPSHLRAALIAYLGVWHEPGVSLQDLKSLLLPPPADEGYGNEPPPSPSTLNGDIQHFDLTGALGRLLKLRELSDLLFPPVPGETRDSLQDSWDTPEQLPIHLPLLPTLTHLSLSIDPQNSSSVSWKQLLAFSSHLPRLTHLSLAYWPEPSLTPNAKFASVVTASGRMVQYGGTNPYSHSLDGDWSEAISVLRRLSRNLYGLEYLDLTGCASWNQALTRTAEHDFVDWSGHWGKITTLILRSGFSRPSDNRSAEADKYTETIMAGRRVERHIRSQRAGKGRWITVETDLELEGI